MHIAKNDIPIKVNAPGAVARQKPDLEDATGYGKMGGEYFAMDAGTDIAPLLQGFEDDLCQSPHWGCLIKGRLTVSYKNGEAEDANSGDLFYGPPGHTVKVGKDAEMILYSPQHEHTQVPDHINNKLGA